jgi:FkbM family methyltransferase
MKSLISFIQKITSNIYIRGIPKILFLLKSFYSSKDKKYFLSEGIYFNLDLSDYFQNTILWGYYEVGVSYFVKKFLKKGDIFVDVGANIGFFSVLAASRVKESGEVHIFEPNQALMKTVNDNFEINNYKNFHLNAKGLSNDNLDKHFVIGVQHAFSQIANSEDDVSFQSKEVTSISCITFDEYIEQTTFNPQKIKLIKIDAEGHDLHVLEGMTNFLANNSANVIFENSLASLDKNPMGQTLQKIIKDFSYNLYKIKYQNESNLYNFKVPLIEQVAPFDLKSLENDYCDVLITKLSLDEIKKI